MTLRRKSCILLASMRFLLRTHWSFALLFMRHYEQVEQRCDKSLLIIDKHNNQAQFDYKKETHIDQKHRKADEHRRGV